MKDKKQSNSLSTSSLTRGIPLRLHPPSRPNPPDATPRSPSRQNRDSECTTTICRSCPRIDEYIAAVETAEGFYPALKSNPAKMVTALRKIWYRGIYNTWEWDRMLEGAETDPLWTPRTVAAPDLAAQFSKCEWFSETAIWSLREIDCLRTPQHICVDFGHVLTGIDATNFPDANDLLIHELDTPKKVIAAVTWSGDLGSVYEDYEKYVDEVVEHLSGERKQTAEKRFDELWREYAPIEDLLGDVDGVVLGARFSHEQPFSIQLRNYYVGADNSQSAIFKAFEQEYPIKSRTEYVYSYLDAHRRGAPSSSYDWLLSWVTTKFEQFVADGKAGAIRNTCESVRKKARLRPSSAAGGGTELAMEFSGEETGGAFVDADKFTFLIGEKRIISVRPKAAPANAELQWTVTPIGNHSATITPNTSTSRQFDFSPQVTSAQRPMDGSKDANLPVEYDVKLQLTVAGETRSKTQRIKQDRVDVIRQEYLDFVMFCKGFDLEVPPRAEIVTPMNAALNTKHNYVAWNLIRDKGMGRMYDAVAAVAKKNGGRLIVNSAWRNPRRNLKVGGKVNSKHQRALALDLEPAVSPKTAAWRKGLLDIYNAALAAGGTEVLLEQWTKEKTILLYPKCRKFTQPSQLFNCQDLDDDGLPDTETHNGESLENLFNRATHVHASF